MKREREMGQERLALAGIEQREQQGERKHHQDDQRLGVKRHRAVEQRRIGLERGLRQRQAARHHRLRDRAPVLVMQVRVERGGKDVEAGQRLDREEQPLASRNNWNGAIQAFRSPLM